MKFKKLNVFLSIIVLLVISLIIVGFSNKTFFKNYYPTTNSSGKKIKIPLPTLSYYRNVKGKYEVTFDTLRSVESIRNILNNYVENLKPCYDESYFYDQDLDITISKYSVLESFPFNKITLKYTEGNYCENEYVLPDNWIDEFIKKAEIIEINIKSCTVLNNNVKCDEKTINKEYVINLFDFTNKVNYTRIENKNNISINESKDHKIISVYYSIEKKNYVLSTFIYDNEYLAFRITDENDHSKNALYKVDMDLNLIFENLYNG